MRACACAYRARARAQESLVQVLAFFGQMSYLCPVVNNKQINKSMDKLKKFELCVVFTDRNGTSYDCFVPLLGPASFPSLEGSDSKEEIPFDMWISNRLSKWLHASFVTVGDISVAVSLLRDFEYAPFFIVRSFDDLTKLGYRVLSIIMRQIF